MVVGNTVYYSTLPGFLKEFDLGACDNLEIEGWRLQSGKWFRHKRLREQRATTEASRLGNSMATITIQQELTYQLFALSRGKPLILQIICPGKASVERRIYSKSRF